jgi:hypothetical protein
MVKFYYYKHKIDALKKDLKWLADTQWERAVEISMFQSNVSDTDAAATIGEMLGWMSLGTLFSFSDNQLNFTLDSLIGTLMSDARLNDNVLNAAILHILNEDTVQGYLVDSLVVQQQAEISIPNKSINTVKCVVIPVNMDNFHWVLMSVHIDPDGFQVSLYDPMCDDSNLDHLEVIWISKICTMMSKWFRRDHGVDPVKQVITREKKPKQNDGVSCGIFVLAMAHAHLTQDFSFCSLRVNKAYLNVIRLRTAYKLMNHMEITVTQRDGKATAIAQDIERTLTK